MGPCKQQEPCKRRDEGGDRRRILVSVVVCLFAALAFSAPTRAERPGVALQLEVSVNGAPLHLIGAFTLLPNGGIAATAQELAELGIKVPAALARQDLTLLDDIPGVAYAYAAGAQSIDIRLDRSAQAPKVLDALGAGAAIVEAQTTPGAVLNYGLFASAASHRGGDLVALDGVSAMLDGRAFGALGTLAMSGLARGFSDAGEPLLRLDTTWSRSDPHSLVTYKAGDFISGGLPWTRPIRMGGLQAQRNFSLRPDLITMPLPNLSGSAAVPSTVDVYVNNTKAYSADVPAGPFLINNIPTVSGAGLASVVVRDASGRETSTTAPLYASTSLLRPGIFDFSAEAGFVRRNYGQASNDYGDDLVASLSWRYGLTDWLTSEGHTEAASNLINSGIGASMVVAPWGRLSGAVSLSASEDGIGGQTYMALEFRAFGIDGRASSQRTIGDYADLASVAISSERASLNPTDFIARLNGAKPPRALDQLSLSVPLAFDTTRLALSFIRVDPRDAPESDILSASYTRSITERVTLIATAFHDFAPHGGTGAFVGVMVPLGDKATATTSLTRDKFGTGYGVDAARPLGSEPGTVGWQARLSGGDAVNGMGAIAYRAEAATLQGRVVRSNGGTAGTAEMTGAVVAAGGGVFATNRIDDAFAVVDVGVANVDVLNENRRAATTNADGKALVTGLRSYQKSTISIDPSGLPVDAEIARTEAKVTPANSGGVMVDFGVRPQSSSALAIFRFPDGKLLPVGARGRIEATQGEFVIGYDGQTYLKDLAANNVAVVDLVDGRCRAVFPYQAAGQRTIIDPVICRP